MSKDTITVAEATALMTTATGKYRSRRTYVPELERWFASAHEAEQAVILWRRQQAGEITGLRFQVAYPLRVNGILVCTYVADFLHVECATGRTVVGDAKGVMTPVYKLKRMLLFALHGIVIEEM